MCGIAGVVQRTDVPADAAQVRRMCDAIVHRGPDDEGIFAQGPVGLGMRRLSIIDLASGHQPIHNEDKSVWVVFNGEIYNYAKLRAELEKQGHRFYTNSDTETLVHLYEQYGEEMVHHLNGMFAFAIWDVRTRKLFIARDRVGEKQLYYSVSGGRLLFGSEPKCLLVTGEVSTAMDPVAVDEYLAYLYVPAPRTIYRDIRELPAGHSLVFERGELRVQRYWDLQYRVDRSMDEGQFIEAFRERFAQAVKSRLVADVPLGALLSGGVDSSAIVAVMASQGAGQVKTYCIGYGDDGAYYDERRYAKIVADKFGTEHHEFIVKPDIVSELPAIVKAFDQPFADSSAVVNYYVYRETRKHVKVVLSGLGGDEVAAGYERHLGMRLRQRYRAIPSILREQLVERAIAALPDSRRGSRLVERAKRFVRSGRLPDDLAYRQIQSAFDDERKRSLYTKGFAAELQRGDRDDTMEHFFNRDGISDVVDRALYTDLMTYLPGDLLPLTDRMSMAHSIEARAPFLDHELVEFMATVPSNLKIRGLSKKYILKRAFEGVLPAEIMHRRKQGFTVPLSVWFRNQLAPLLKEQLSEERMNALGLFEPSEVKRLLDEHQSGRENHHSRIWALLMFSMWHEQYQGQTAGVN